MSRKIEFESLLNTRDLGGMTGMDGRKIRPGKLIRSGHLHPASAKDLEKIAGLADTIVDFRSDQECREKPEAEIPGVSMHHIPIFGSAKAGVTRDEESFAKVMKNMLFDPLIARDHMCRTYADFVTGEFAVRQFEQFIRLLLEDHQKAILWHCTAGKDRTGFAAVIIQKLLGVCDADIAADYLMTNACLEPETRGLTEMMKKRPGASPATAEEAVKYIFTARIEYLETVFDKISETYGSFDRFILDGLHITPEEQAKIRETYLEPK